MADRVELGAPADRACGQRALADDMVDNQAGLSFLPIVVPIMIAGAVVGPFLDRIPPRAAVGAALGLVGAGLLLMLGVTEHTGFGHLVPGLVLTGLGCGTALPALGSLAVDVPPSRTGVAAGVNNTALQLGLAVSIAVYGAVLADFPGTPAGFADGLNHLIAIAAGVALTGAAVAAVLLRPVR
jgi:MFS family permease